MVLMRQIMVFVLASIIAFWSFWLGGIVTAAIIVAPVALIGGREMIQSVFQPIETVLATLSVIGGILTGGAAFIFVVKKSL